MIPEPRPSERRRSDTLARLEREVDAWIASAGAAGEAPHLVPLSFLWDGATLLVATPAASVTARNLLATGRVRVGIGPTRDVVVIDGRAEAVPGEELTEELADAFAAKAGFDPRRLSDPYVYLRIRPVRIQAWREANELPGRDLMRAGRWLA